MFEPLEGIIKYVEYYYNSLFKFSYFFLVLFMLGVIGYLKYYQTGVFDTGAYTWMQNFVVHYLLYFIPFAAAFGLQYLFYKDSIYHKSRWFWILIILAPAFFSLRVNFNSHQPLVKQIWNGPEQHYWLSLFNLIIKVLVISIPLILIWFVKDRNKQPLYGFYKISSIRPYIIIIILMLPILLVAIRAPVFLKHYPVIWHIKGETNPIKFIYLLLYECCYALDFFSIEFFFRGFLILAFISIGGLQAIIPVACFYCCIHLGKPMPEAISSFFGGILLGIISYNTKSIWGGLIIHIGIAWLIELLAFFQLQ